MLELKINDLQSFSNHNISKTFPSILIIQTFFVPIISLFLSIKLQPILKIQNSKPLNLNVSSSVFTIKIENISNHSLAALNLFNYN